MLPNKMGFDHLLPNTSITQKLVGRGKKFLLNVVQFWGTGDSSAPLQSVPQNTDSHQPAPEPESVSRHPAPFSSALLGTKAVKWAGLWLSSSRLALSLECALVGPATSLPHHRFFPLPGLGVRSLQLAVWEAPCTGSWHPRPLMPLELANVPDPCICVLLSEQGNWSILGPILCGTVQHPMGCYRRGVCPLHMHRTQPLQAGSWLGRWTQKRPRDCTLQLNLRSKILHAVGASNFSSQFHALDSHMSACVTSLSLLQPP